MTALTLPRLCANASAAPATPGNSRAPGESRASARVQQDLLVDSHFVIEHKLAVQPARPELCMADAHHVHGSPGRRAERARTAVGAGQRPAKRSTGSHVGVGSADLVVNLKDRIGQRTAQVGPESARLVPAVNRLAPRPL